jgi:hypothetical protein
MIAVFWKEMRENLRWASLAFAAMAATLILMWRGSQLVFDDGDPHTFAGMIAVFTVIALAILQTRRDKRPASRALLLHRGITADAAFAGKLLAGLALYSFAVFVPLLAMALFIAINGIDHKAASPLSVAPMALRSLTPFAFWPVALLIVQRDARIFGSRLIPAVTTLFALPLCFLPLDTTRALLVFLLMYALMISVLLLAARSVFTNCGQVATGIGRAALALTVSFGLLMFLYVALVAVLTVDAQRSTEPAGVDRHYAAQMGPAGQPWLVCNEHSHQHDSDQLAEAAKMEIGRSVRDQLQPIAEEWKKTPHWSVDRRDSDDERGFWTRFTRIASAPSSSSAGFKQRQWVFDYKSDTILVYHLTSSNQWQLVRRLRAPGPVGSFGQIGRASQSDRDGRFTLVTSAGAFYVPGDGSEIVAMYPAPTSSTILGSVERHTHDKNEPFSMMLRLADRVVLLESDLEETAASQARLIGEVGNLGSLYVTEIQLPSELAVTNETGRIGNNLYVREIQSLSIARDPEHDGAYLGLAQSGHPNERRILWARFDASGQIAAQQQFTENTSPDYAENTSSDAISGESVAAVMPPAVFVLGAGFAVISMDDAIESLWESDWKSDWESAKEDPAETARAILLYLLQPIVGMALAIWAARRRRLGKRETWIGIAWGFLMGPAGSLSILAVYPRIVRERCTSCRKPTRIDLDRCEHCGHSADDVPRIGIEIFDRDIPAVSKPPETIGSC